MDIESRMTVLEAMDGAQLHKIEKLIGKVNIIKTISFFITNLNNNYNGKYKLTDEQIVTLSGDLFDVFKYESLEDTMLMFKYARQGKIGDSNDYKLDSQTIFRKWVPDYLELKAIEREAQHNKSKSSLNNVTDFNWKKEDLDNFEVDEKLVLPTKIGQRMKEKLNVDEKPVIILKERRQYLETMYYEARKMSVEQLKNYLVVFDVKSGSYDEDLYKLVEKEIDRRLENN